MTQVNKFYLASFLKNQTYFVPIIVLFFQDLGLSYSQIFWIFTIGSIFSFVLEIPTGIFADLYGKRRSIIISKFLIFVSFILFGFSFDFLSLLLANIIYELGKSFRSGTETAYVYGYLSQTKGSPNYILVKANQKFYARISESIGTALGGFIAYKFGFNFAFFIAAIPALINFIQTFSWSKLEECGQAEKKFLKDNIKFAKDSIKESFLKSELRKIILNTALFSAAVLSLDKFIQPYMKDVGVHLQYFGVIYSGFLLLLAFLAKYAANLEEKFGAVKIINYISLISFVPIILIGLGLSSFWGIGLFFFVMMVENIRSPISNALFHDYVSSKNRATMGSIMELFQSAIALMVLPIIGHAADLYSMNTAIIFISIIVLISSLLFWLSTNHKKINAGI
ncbi:MFS transporter [Candidatus Parcubacteria bacterium]|nr:MAG: MFS transporter [Candidatus Parcubacteria bacterium]